MVAPSPLIAHLAAMHQEPRSAPHRGEPLINAPWVVAGVAILIVGLHAAAEFSSVEERARLVIDYSVFPARFFAEPGDGLAYAGRLDAWMTLLTSGLLHGGWAHVLVNAGMLLGLGTQPARYLGPGPVGSGKWMLVYLGAVAAGSGAYLLLAGPGGGPAVGASGGVSGMFAATFLLHPAGGLRSLVDRDFLSMSVAFAAINLILVLVGPMLLGADVAWQAHAGGYVGGAVMMMLVGQRPNR